MAIVITMWFFLEINLDLVGSGNSDCNVIIHTKQNHAASADNYVEKDDEFYFDDVDVDDFLVVDDDNDDHDFFFECRDFNHDDDAYCDDDDNFSYLFD